MPTVHEWQWRPTGAYFFAMLVSAAIDPYRKSYGNSRNNSATTTGTSASERMTASPRKTCVPGVQACATAGATAMARTTNTAQRRTLREPRAFGTALNTETLALAPHGAPEILELRLDDIVDRLAGATQVLAHVI